MPHPNPYLCYKAHSHQARQGAYRTRANRGIPQPFRIPDPDSNSYPFNTSSQPLMLGSHLSIKPDPAAPAGPAPAPGSIPWSIFRANTPVTLTLIPHFTFTAKCSNAARTPKLTLTLISITVYCAHPSISLHSCLSCAAPLHLPTPPFTSSAALPALQQLRRHSSFPSPLLLQLCYYLYYTLYS